MNSLSRIIFFIFGIAMPILIGALHLLAHFNDLLTPEIKSILDRTIPMFNSPTSIWNTWGLMSFMMGASFVVIGILNLSSFRRLSKTEAPPTGLFVGMMVYLVSVIYAGHTFSAQPQFYGGIVGLLAMITAMVALKTKNSHQ